MAYVANDVYLNISQVLSRGFIALAGDSHAREVSRWMRPLREDNNYGGLRLHQTNGHVQGFVRGGMTSFQYYQSVLYEQLKVSSANIIAFIIGGNGLDSEHPQTPESVYKIIIKMYNELTALGKIVFIIESPKRFTVRVSSLDNHDKEKQNLAYLAYEKRRKRLAYLLARGFKARFIALPSNFFNECSFKKQWGNKYVHLKDEYYRDLADLIFKVIEKDLSEGKTLPSTINPYSKE